MCSPLKIICSNFIKKNFVHIYIYISINTFKIHRLLFKIQDKNT